MTFEEQTAFLAFTSILDYFQPTTVMERLSSAAVTLLLITEHIHCKSANLRSFSKPLHSQAENYTISLTNVKVRDGILTFNGVEVEEDGIRGGSKGGQGQRGRIIQYPDFAKSIDRTVDPCQDFYSFVCNGWIRSHPIPQDQYQYTQTELLKERIKGQLKEILSTPCSESSREEQLMTTFYNKCIENAYSKSKDGFRLMFAKLREVRRLATITDWLLSMRTERLFHELTVSVDEENSTRNVLQIVPSSPILTSQIYFDPAYSQQFLATREVLFRMLAIIASEDHRSEFISENILEHIRRVESLLRVDQIVAKISEETEFDTGSIAVTVAELQSMMTSVILLANSVIR
ncbi:hypothetical protein OESDEN_01710 [Oesophagostomum dentatum]|uniref:Peptidase M13 N-terminal domain-containing protein n=1 Tax=Oesophagostomum dentatum TaxID=61180 RepID=A0A0B1TR52_OESDE|nr:hypothetical protein OESDEN_01710 [Oesophagostomum dentatum]